MELSKETFIRIIHAAAEGIDWEEFGTTVATIDPDFFVKVLEKMNTNWVFEARTMFNNGVDRPTVVRYVRDAARMPLKEAKTWVDTNLDYPDTLQED